MEIRYLWLRGKRKKRHREPSPESDQLLPRRLSYFLFLCTTERNLAQELTFFLTPSCHPSLVFLDMRFLSMMFSFPAAGFSESVFVYVCRTHAWASLVVQW